MNLWTRDETPERNHEDEEQMRMFLKDWGPMPDSNAGEVTLPDLDAQFEAIVSVKPKAISSIMGVFSLEKVQVLKSSGIIYMVTVTTLKEAHIAVAAGRVF